MAIDLYYWPTPNGHKVTMFLEEAGLDYQIHPIDIGKGEQFAPEFLSIAPNNRIPAIVDRSPQGGGEPITVFESGAILLYLADKTGQFLPDDLRQRVSVLEWTFWQVGGLGPMLGQNHHFSQYAPEPIPYAITRYVNETTRLYRVLDHQLRGQNYIVGEYSIADMMAYPWIVPYEKQGQTLSEFPNLQRWFEAIASRPATMRAYEVAQSMQVAPGLSDRAKSILFGQTAPEPPR